MACSRQNVPGRSINFSYSFSLIRSFVFCTGCNWFWSSQLRIKFLNLSWKVKIYLLTWRRKLRYRDPPPPLTKLLIFALLEKGKRKKKNICLGISLISQCLVGAVTTRTKYALLYLSKAIWSESNDCFWSMWWVVPFWLH